MTPRRAAIYARISKDRTGAGLGVDRQEAECRELAERLGYTVVSVYRDNDLSAYSGKPRPGYEEMLGSIRAGRIDVVLAWHLDRLHRRPVELEAYIAVCEPREVSTHTVQAGALDLATPSGRMVARQLGAVARYEVEHAIQRQRSKKLQAAAEGKWRGGRRPFGFAVDGVTVIPDEAAEIVRACEAFLAGTSLRSIAAGLNHRGVLTSTGKEWRQDTLRKMLARPRNAGFIDHHGKIIGPAQWEPVVPEATWRAVVAILDNPGRLSHLNSVRRWVGAGLYWCGVEGCPHRVKSSASTRSRSHFRSLYICSGPTKHLGRSCDDVDAFVERAAVKRLSQPDAASLYAQQDRPDTADLRAQAVTLRSRLTDLATLFAAGDIDARQLAEATKRIRAQLDEAEAALAQAASGSVLAGLVGVDDVAERWAELDLDRKRAAIDRLMVVTLLPTGKGRPAGWRPGQSYFRPDSVRIEWRGPEH